MRNRDPVRDWGQCCSIPLVPGQSSHTKVADATMCGCSHQRNTRHSDFRKRASSFYLRRRHASIFLRRTPPPMPSLHTHLCTPSNTSHARLEYPGSNNKSKISLTFVLRLPQLPVRQSSAIFGMTRQTRQQVVTSLPLLSRQTLADGVQNGENCGDDRPRKRYGETFVSSVAREREHGKHEMPGGWR